MLYLKWGTNSPEKLGGTNNDDMILAYNGDDAVYGYGGNDYLFGMGGSDLLHGGAGADYLDGGDWADDLYGDDGDDHLFGMSGDDYLNGGAGADYLDGGTGGLDLTSYRYSPAGVFVSLTTGQGLGFGGDAEGDTLVSIEVVHGSAYDDLLSAYTSVAGYHLNGLEGNDTLFGSEGADTLYGGAGRDFLMGGGGDDYLAAGTGDVTYGDGDYTGSNSLDGGDGEDYLAAGLGSDRLTGGDDCDTFGFEAAEVRIHEYAVESTSTSPASDPDHITDFEGRDDLIDMNVAGTATNYIETALGYNAGYLAAENWARTAMPGGNGGLRFGFVTDGVNGYLFGDLDDDQYIETGVVLEGLTSLNDFHYSLIVV